MRRFFAFFAVFAVFLSPLAVAQSINNPGGTIPLYNAAGTGWLKFTNVSPGLSLGVGAGATKLNDTAASEDVFIGYAAGTSAQTGVNTFHTFVGSQAGASAAAGTGGVAIGQKSLISATSLSTSVAVGSKAFANLTSALSDVAVGYNAGTNSNATNLGGRVFLGYGAGLNDNGDRSIAIGYFAGPQTTNSTTSNAENIAIGYLTLDHAGGFRNIAMGSLSGYNVTTGGANIFIGYNSGIFATSASTNVWIGSGTGGSNTTVGRSIFLGTNAGSSVPDATQNIFVAGASTNDRIDDVYFSEGYSDATPTGWTLHGTNGSGSNIGGGDTYIAGGMGTGTGIGGSVKLRVAPAGSTGSALNNLVDALTIDSTRAATWSGVIPVVTGTGTPTIATGSTDTAGEVTGGTLATSIVITFSVAKTNAPFCTVTSQSALASFGYTISTTAITISLTATTGEKVNYVCFQH